MSEEIRPIKRVDLNDFFTVLYKIDSGAQFAGILTETEPRFNKSCQYYGRVIKRQEHNVQINFNYSNAVNNIREKEGNQRDFIPADIKWGKRITDTPIIVHVPKEKGIPSYYLMTRVLHSKVADYYLDGQFVDMIPLRDDICANIKGGASNHLWQGVSKEKEVIIRTFKLESIKRININKVTYIVEV